MGVEGIGARVVRKEDRRFITGQGRYVDDVKMVGMLTCQTYRSQKEQSPALATLQNSILWEIAVHHLDALRYVLGQRAAAVVAQTFTQPWSDAPPGASMAEERQPRGLVIDDDSGIREVVRSLLASFGYDCQTAADGAQGLARFDEGGWDLVLTDLAMPEMNGWEVAEAIRQRSSTIPIVLITGLTDPEVVRRAGEGRLPVVQKPYRMEMLRVAVANALQTCLLIGLSR